MTNHKQHIEKAREKHSPYTFFDAFRGISAPFEDVHAWLFVLRFKKKEQALLCNNLEV